HVCNRNIRWGWFGWCVGPGITSGNKCAQNRKNDEYARLAYGEAVHINHEKLSERLRQRISTYRLFQRCNWPISMIINRFFPQQALASQDGNKQY
ncbi:MAG: hypothetical protein DWB48_09140, partial [Nitrosomonas sp.]|nr:hypothetical protein [Nitrosomonas sp.]